MTPLEGIGDTPSPADLRERIVFVLVRPLQSGNVGAVARAMKNMGLRRLVVVAPPALDIDKARWMAPGATDILESARYVRSVAEGVEECHHVYATTARGRHHRWPAVTPEGLAEGVFTREGATAVLFGPEDRGLDNAELAHAHALVHIPTAAHASLNLGQAALLVGAALFSAATARGHVDLPDGPGRRGGPPRQGTPGATPAHVPAPMGASEPLLEEWMSTLAMGNYLVGHEPVLVEGTVRRILGRASLDEQEISILRGMLRKLRYRMTHPV